jgi:glucose-6-phosphate dehydrogenase assembly protein OpcA
MSSPEILQRFLRGEELAVAVDQIENVLAMLWQAVPAERNLTRARETNLIVHMNSPALIEQATALVREFAKRHPCRALLLALNPYSEENEMAAAVTPLFHAHDDTRSVTGSELILIIAGGEKVREVYPAASALVLPDLPAAFWYVQGIPAETPLLEGLLEKEPRLVFDSNSVEDLGVTLARAHALLEKNKHVADLNWQRLAPWRTQLEKVLSTPEGSGLAENAEKIVLHVGGEILDEKRIGAAVLMMSWLARRGDWKLVETLDYAECGFRALWETAGREVVSEIMLADTAASDLHALELSAHAANEKVVLHLARAENAAGFALQTTLSRHAQNLLPVSTLEHVQPSLQELFIHEFERADRDEVYKDTLALATQLV